jgi:hypothetical protein
MAATTFSAMTMTTISHPLHPRRVFLTTILWHLTLRAMMPNPDMLAMSALDLKPLKLNGALWRRKFIVTGFQSQVTRP